MTKLTIPDVIGATLDHIAVAVRDLDDAARLYATFGIIPIGRETIAGQGVEVLMLPVGDARLELLMPLSPDSPISKYIDKRGTGGIHHIALRVDNIQAALESCRANGIVPIDSEVRYGAEGKLIAFLNPKTTGGVLIELVQQPSE